MQSQILGVTTPLISVIVPVYNVEKYLRKCVDSVLSQTYTNLEIILVDDGSTDNSGKICDEYALKDPRIIVIHKQNGGLSSARNCGMKKAIGRFYAFVDSDDWIENIFIETLYNTLCKFKTQIACVGYYNVKEGKMIAKQIAANPSIISSQQALQQSFGKLGFFAWNKLFAVSLFNQITFPNGQLFEDMATIYKVFLQTDKVAISNLSLYYYNQSNMSSITKNKFSVKKLDYFKSSGAVLSYAKKMNDKFLTYIILRERAYHISGFFRQMAAANFQDLQVITPMQKELRHNIFKLLFSHHKLTNKLFAVVCCINFNLACNIYRIINGIKERRV